MIMYSRFRALTAVSIPTFLWLWVVTQILTPSLTGRPYSSRSLESLKSTLRTSLESSLSPAQRSICTIKMRMVVLGQ